MRAALVSLFWLALTVAFAGARASAELPTPIKFPAEASSCPTPQPLVKIPVSEASPDPATMARAKEWIARIQNGDIDRSQMNAFMNCLLSPGQVKRNVAMLAPLGAPVRVDFLDGRRSDEANGYMYVVRYQDRILYWYLVSDPTGKLIFLGFTPSL